MSVTTVVAIAITLALLAGFFVERQRRASHPVSGGRQQDTIVEHTASLELYSNSFSHCSRKVRFALAELGLTTKHHPIELIETGWYQTISPDYLKINPSGLVPTLVHNGHPIYESDDILAYAQSIAGADAQQLVPLNPDLAIEMERWLGFAAIVSSDAMGEMEKRAGACIPGLTLPMFVSCIQYVPFRRILVGLLFHFDKKRPLLFATAKLLGLRRTMQQRPLKAIVQPSRKHMKGHLQTLNEAISTRGNKWLLGDEFSLADISIACLLLRLDETGWLDHFSESGSISSVVAYYARVKARPAWGEAIDAHDHPIVAKARRDLAEASIDPATRELIYGHH